MKDRISTYAGRIRLTHVSGSLYDMEMADQPVEAGTPLNKALFDFLIAAVGTTGGTAEALTLYGDGGFGLTDGATIRFKLHTDSGVNPTINVDNTGAKSIKTQSGIAMPFTPAGTWVTATYSSTLDFFVLASSARAQKYTPRLLDEYLGYSPLYGIMEASI